jgi:hypothetical protein
MVDISMLHPRYQTNTLAATQNRGAAAALRDRSKYRVHPGICTPVTLLGHRPGKTFNSATGLPARVQITVQPSATSHLLNKLLGKVRLGFLVVSPFRIACVLLHVERGRSSKQVWRSPRIYYYLS